MIDGAYRALVVTAAGAFPVIVAGIGGALTQEHFDLIYAISGAVVAVVASIAWIDSRIEKKIRTHTAEDKLRHKIVLSKIHTVHTILAIKEGLPLPVPDEDEEDKL